MKFIRSHCNRFVWNKRAHWIFGPFLSVIVIELAKYLLICSLLVVFYFWCAGAHRIYVCVCMAMCDIVDQTNYLMTLNEGKNSNSESSIVQLQKKTK